MDNAQVTAGVSSEPLTYVIWPMPSGCVVITASALAALRQRDLAAYMDLIHESPDLWESEWDWDHPEEQAPS